MPMDETEWVTLLVRPKPQLTDPKELQSILIFSLKDLWGEFEPYSYSTTITGTQTKGLFTIKCQSVHVAAVRAALTLSTRPPFLQDTQLFRFDISGA